jgi:hypothetical protein
MRLIRNSFAALILLGVACIIGMRVSAPYRRQRELTRKLPFFQKVISGLHAPETALSGSSIKVPVPEEGRDMAYSIVAERTTGGHLAVLFLTGSGFPVKHRGYLFLSSGRIDDFPKMVSGWPKRTQLRDNWLYIGD